MTAKRSSARTALHTAERPAPGVALTSGGQARPVSVEMLPPDRLPHVDEGRRLRLLVVARPSEQTQAAGWLLQLLQDTRRLDVTVALVHDDGPSQPWREAGARTVALSWGAGLVGRVRLTRRLVEVLRRTDPDVVLVDGSSAAAALRQAAFLTGHRVVRLELEQGAQGPAAHLVDGKGRALIAASAIDAGWANRVVSALAAVAGRAGAGLDPADTAPVSLVVPVWNEGALVDTLVDTLSPQLRERDELVLVDDASPDDTGERVERAAARHPQVVAVRRTTNGRAGAARNSGVAVAQHERLVFTDAGCHWGPSWLDALRTAFAEEPQPDLVAGTYRVSRADVFEAAMAVGCYPDLRDVRRSGPLTTLWSALFGRRFDATRPAGRSVATTRQAIDRVGGWPEGQIAHEDVDLARAIADLGLRCVMTTDADLLWDQAGPLGSWAMYVRYGRGDALASDRQALARDAARAGAYVVGPVALLAGGPVSRTAVALGAALYFAVPLARAGREQRPLVTAALVPLVIALKDLAKAYGAAQVLLERRRRDRSPGRTPTGADGGGSS